MFFKIAVFDDFDERLLLSALKLILMGVEPTFLFLECPNQLDYRVHTNSDGSWTHVPQYECPNQLDDKNNLAPKEGHDPPTFWLTVRRSTNWATWE